MEELIERIDYYHEVVENFIEILKEENQALADYKLDIVKALYERKAKAVNAYRMLISFFIKNQDAMKELDDASKEDLREVAIELDELLKENDRLLKARMETSKSVMDTIINLAKMQNNANSTSYGSGGGYAPQDRSKNALAINRTL